MTVNIYGYEEADWEAAKTEAIDILIATARRRGRIPYSHLTSQISSIAIEPDDPRLSHFLDEISSQEEANGRGLLTAIVVHKNGNMHPGPGFFELAQRCGRDTDVILRCWIEEFNNIHDYWANRNPT